MGKYLGVVCSVWRCAVMINDSDDITPDSFGNSLLINNFALWCSSSSIIEIQLQLQFAVDNIETWRILNGFPFSTSQTDALRFYRRLGASLEMVVTQYGSAAAFQRTIKFVGVFLDTRVTYTDHLTLPRITCLKAMDVFKTFKFLIRHEVDTRSLLFLCRSLVRSRLDYTSIVYNLAPKSE